MPAGRRSKSYRSRPLARGGHRAHARLPHTKASFLEPHAAISVLVCAWRPKDVSGRRICKRSGQAGKANPAATQRLAGYRAPRHRRVSSASAQYWLRLRMPITDAFGQWASWETRSAISEGLLKLRRNGLLSPTAWLGGSARPGALGTAALIRRLFFARPWDRSLRGLSASGDKPQPRADARPSATHRGETPGRAEPRPCNMSPKGVHADRNPANTHTAGFGLDREPARSP